MPGLFLFTDGLTLSRLERALSRIDGAVGAAEKLRHLLRRTRRATSKESRLFEQAVRALATVAPRVAVAGLLSSLTTSLDPLLRAYDRVRE